MCFWYEGNFLSNFLMFGCQCLENVFQMNIFSSNLRKMTFLQPPGGPYVDQSDHLIQRIAP